MNATAQKQSQQALRQHGFGQNAFERRQPATQEHGRSQQGNQNDVRILGEEEYREGHGGIFDVETGDDFRFTLGHVERRAIGFRQAGDEIDKEQRQQGPHEPLHYTALLGGDDLAQVQAAGRQQHADQSKAHGDLIRDDLRRGTQRAKEGIFRIRGPASDNDAVYAQRGHGKDIQQAGIDVRNDQAIVERHHRPGRQGGANGEDRAENKQEQVGVGRQDGFLEQQLDGIRDGLQQAPRADAVGADADLDIADNLAFRQRQVGHGAQQREQQCEDLQKNDQQCHQAIGQETQC